MSEILGESKYKQCAVEVRGMGFNTTGYPGAFTPIVESIIKAHIEKPCVHLFSGISKLGDVRIDLARPEATQNENVLDFVRNDKRMWKWCLLDPPYLLADYGRKFESGSLEEKYASVKSMSADVELRRAIQTWFQDHVENILWLDHCAPLPLGFKREKLWILLPGGYHTVRVLSWLKRVSHNINSWVKDWDKAIKKQLQT